MNDEIALGITLVIAIISGIIGSLLFGSAIESECTNFGVSKVGAYKLTCEKIK